MEFLGKLSLFIHIVVGISTLIAGPIALFYNRNTKKHKIAGKVFFYSMAVVVITSFTGFIKHPTVIFYQFLLFIGILVGFHIIRGFRAIFFMKGSLQPTFFDRQWAWMAIISGILMLGTAAYHLTTEAHIAFPILFGVFGLGSLADGRYFLRLLSVQKLDRRWWFQLHINSMFAAFMASTTAFAVNAASFAPWYIQWFAPTLILLPLQLYLLKKRKVSRKDLGNPFAEVTVTG
ncbi:MAG: hypothetical protein AAFZ15_16430 [Bacteroidota bacterium]